MTCRRGTVMTISYGRLESSRFVTCGLYDAYLDNKKLKAIWPASTIKKARVLETNQVHHKKLSSVWRRVSRSKNRPIPGILGPFARNLVGAVHLPILTSSATYAAGAT